jgi:hypothetical protein
MNNREKLNSMSDKDLAGLFCEAMEKISDKADIDMCDICPVRTMCRKGSTGFLNWLQADAVEKERSFYNKERLIDRIRGMSVTELAEFLGSKTPIDIQASEYVCKRCKKIHGGECPCEEGKCIYGNTDTIRGWLLQEVEE